VQRATALLARRDLLVSSRVRGSGRGRSNSAGQPRARAPRFGLANRPWASVSGLEFTLPRAQVFRPARVFLVVRGRTPGASGGDAWRRRHRRSAGSNRRERRKRREGWFALSARFRDDRSAYESRPPPRDRVRSENRDLLRGTEGADVVDRSLERAARKHGLHGATPGTNLELSTHLRTRRGQRRKLAPGRADGHFSHFCDPDGRVGVRDSRQGQEVGREVVVDQRRGPEPLEQRCQHEGDAPRL
jgi:hypothetical protein